MKNTCSTKVEFELCDDGAVRGIRFTDGCEGNLSAISVLLDGMDAREIIAKLQGIRCGRKKTSCSDQFALAVGQALSERSVISFQKTYE